MQTEPRHATAGDTEVATALARSLYDNLARVLRGKPEVIRLALVALLSGGHLLVEDVPGVGKTLLAKALARSVGGTFRRVQATPDLLPSDLTGVSVFHRGEAGADSWEFRPGPLFANVVLVDEVNRATPRTQSALLEAMEERQITTDGVTRALPDPFFLVATQNPFEHSGTFPLVEGQRDRFAVVVQLGLPGRNAERELLMGVGGSAHLDDLGPVTDAATIAKAITEVHRVHCEPALADYVIDIADATRGHSDIVLGASPRASLGLLHAAQAHAAITGRNYVTPEDIRTVAPAALAHRLILAGGPDLHAATALVHGLLSQVAVPRG
ncbi:MAG TPA: MoxR family ATPase [Acidimicrobiales bacterium]|nr:MoxR family ATPase [Acidimicrobiales bacterium]